jgi:hypothetical protein
MPRYFGETNPLDDPVECAVAVAGCFIVLLGLIALMAVAVVVLLCVIAFK